MLTIVGAALSASIAVTPIVHAQSGTPEATPGSSPEASPEATAEASSQEAPAVTTLFSADLDAFPTAPISIRLLRMTLAPGASSPLHIHPGPEFDLVESGTLSITADGDATVTLGGDATPVGSDGAQLEAGDHVLFEPGTGMSLTNESEEDVVLLSAVFHPVSENTPSTTYPDGDPAPDAFEGVSFDVLGDGIAMEYPEAATTVTLEDVELPAGTDLPASDSVSLYSLVEGNFSFSVDGGDVQVSRTASPGLRPNAAPGQEFTLERGDAAFFPAGHDVMSRADEPDPLRYLRLSATPATDLAGSAAQVTVMPAPAAAAPDSQAEATADTKTESAPTEIAVGATVVTNADLVNLRTDPSVDAEVIDQLGIDVELEIIGGPEEAEDYTWWQVRVVDSDAEGWLAEDFIDLPPAEDTPEAAAEQTPEASGTPDADVTPAADDETFAEGDTVVANDENVRMRDAPGPEGIIINAYPADTEFTITGAPEEVDGTIWYPVTLAGDDSVQGWIAVNFLDAAP